MAASNHQLRSPARSFAERKRTIKMISQIKKPSGIFCNVPRPQAIATASHQAACFRATCAKIITSVTNNIRPLSRRARLTSKRKNGDDTRTATLKPASHDRSRPIRNASHISASAVRPPKTTGQMRTAASRWPMRGRVRVVSQYCKGGFSSDGRKLNCTIH